MSHVKSLSLSRAVFYGGLIAGVLDAADGVVAYYLAAGFSPIQVLQYIASGLYGAAAFEKGLFGALVASLHISSSLLWLPQSMSSQPEYRFCFALTRSSGVSSMARRYFWP